VTASREKAQFAISQVSTAFRSLAPKGRGWGEGVTMIQYGTDGAT
jgi:hypothetical protein